ncbi:hypothetical protein KIN20_012831 [Parelaphostrongylus tenuis]|uniref:BAAT/Acyl-CoA thioester hydrolase C-terminal domain-containing protein n=1 Tax=Parelaphostrongylus tenuis TaxID=148309 RepID=A0AAD5QN28_PARTN|nr:hypothetical protein KIN20_012831 [Parelaphostrongylus tenuis]
MAEQIAMVASSLVPNDVYELVLRLNHFTGTFFGRGFYKANEHGVIDTRKSAPLRGTYSGDGPFPSIIDISGTGGGINEQKGAALASEGFCVLCLAFFQYKTLIKNLNDLDLDYFKNAINWMTSQNFVPNKIGFQGVSFGGLLVHLIAIRNPKVVAVCSINGLHALSDTMKIKEHGEYLPYAEHQSGLVHFVNQTMFTNKCFENLHVTPEADIGIKTAPRTTAFRFVVSQLYQTTSLDDYSTPTVFCTRSLEEDLRNSDHYVEVDFVPGGHLMDPPYFPCHQAVYSKLSGTIQAYGGEPSQHGASQDRVWSNTIQFFKRFLGKPQPVADYRLELARSHI